MFNSFGVADRNVFVDPALHAGLLNFNPRGINTKDSRTFTHVLLWWQIEVSLFTVLSAALCKTPEHLNYRYFCLNMKLVDVVVLSLAVAFLIIGIHQTMVVGFGKAYWAIMLSLVLYFVFNFRKKK